MIMSYLCITNFVYDYVIYKYEVIIMAKSKSKRKGRKTVAFGTDPDHFKLIEDCMKEFGTSRPDTMRRLMTVLVNEYNGVQLSRTKKE